MPSKLIRLRKLAISSIIGFAAIVTFGSTTLYGATLSDGWDSIQAEADGQTVYFNAWGGSDRINAYLEWAAMRINEDYGVTLKHVKVGDIAEVVGQLEAAKTVGRNTEGNVDLMWVNGENFASMKRNELIWGAFADALPNAEKVRQSASIANDFSVPVDGLESPWGAAQLVFIYDSAITPQPPQSAKALLEFARNGGRLAYPAPPAFHGTTFIKQLLLELSDETAALAAPVTDADFESVTAPLWSFLDELHPLLRGKGRTWPNSGEATRQLLDDGELDLALSFNPNEASAAVRSGQLADTVRTYVFENGTIGNTHFVTIPFNTSVEAGAMVVANFMLSVEAQARKADPEFWGDPTVLDVNALESKAKTRFESIDLGKWALPLGSGSVLPEPHASWTAALEKEWLTRYGQ